MKAYREYSFYLPPPSSPKAYSKMLIFLQSHNIWAPSFNIERGKKMHAANTGQLQSTDQPNGIWLFLVPRVLLLPYISLSLSNIVGHVALDDLWTIRGLVQLMN